MFENKKLITLVGPTGIGKTKVAIQLAQRFSTEIISCDSRQFYKEMNIGTAVPNPKELEAATHHFIQHLNIFTDYSVGDYEKDALKKINELFEIYDSLIMVGGSGLFEKAVTQGLDQFPKIENSIREELNRELNEYGIEKLQEELESVDPEYYNQVDKQNPVRLIRALEIYRGTGKTFSSFWKKKQTKRPFSVLKIGLQMPREELYERINKRVDNMMEEGLLKEAELLYPHRKLNSLQTVGYKEIFDYFDGKIDLNFAIEEIKKNSRRYAKRQLTWYRKDEKVHWFHPNQIEEIIEFLEKNI